MPSKLALTPTLARLTIALAVVTAWQSAQAATFTWTTGSFVAGTTAPNPLAAGDLLEISGAGAKSFNGGVAWVNNGSVAWSSTGGLTLTAGTSVTSNGLWDAQADSTLALNTGGQFTNTGTLRKSAGSGSTVVSGAGQFRSSGTLDVQAGTLQFSGGSNQFDAGSTYLGAGRVFVSASSTFSGAQNTQNLVLGGGANRSFTGDAAVVTGLLRWESGALVGGWRIGAGQQLLMDGSSGSRSMSAASLVNDGTVAWANTTSVGMAGASTVHNRGLWDAQADGTLGIGGGSRFTNDGTLRKSGGSGSTVFSGSAAFENNGLLDVQTGTLQIASTGNQFGAGSSYQGAGRVFVSASSTFTGLQQTQNLVLGGGSNRSFAGVGAVVQGLLGWEGGSLTGSWTLGVGQLLQASGTGALLGVSGAGTVFTNQGRVAWASDSDVRIGQGATLRNEGRIDLQTNVHILNPGGGGSFVNLGTLTKQAAGDASIYSVGLTVDNRGTIDVQQGSLRLPNSFVDRGTLSGNGSFVAINGLRSEGTVAPGSQGIGTLAINGDDGFMLDQVSTLAIDLHDPLSHDRLQVGQALSLAGGTLALHCHLDCSFAVGDVLTIATYQGTSAGAFGTVRLNGFASGAFLVQYGQGTVQLRVTEAVTAVPEPGTWALLLAGLAWMGWRRRA